MPNWLYLLLTVPTVSALIGWLTNWQAVKMIFWPERRLGWGALSWQGIVFNHADKFATNLGRVAQQNLLTGRDVIAKLDLAELDATIAGPLEASTPPLVERAAAIVAPGAWPQLAEPMRQMIIAQVRARSQVIARELAVEMAPRLAAELDIEEVVRAQLSGPNVRRLARLTHEIGHKEFRFIEWSGGVFGWIIGLGQLTVWSVMQLWWTMPIFGVIVGLVTNWLALQMIFRPYERTRYLGVLPYQGLFPKRQAEISRDYGRTTAAEVITPATLLDTLVQTPRAERLRGALSERLSARLDSEWAAVRAMVPLPVSAPQLEQIKALVMEQILASAAELRPVIEAQMAERLQIGPTVESRLSALPKPEFERLLRGVFQEDELTLIVVGGVLGGLVGLLQAAIALA
jgi:uncharacterized membrane protein YheB (UPF0754 family)